MALTQFAIDNMKPSPGRREIADGKVAGLYLVVQPSGKRSWALRYRHLGLPRKYTIGPYPGIGLKAARARASAEIASVAGGHDPSAAKRTAKVEARLAVQTERDSVERVVVEFIEKHAKPNNRESTSREAERVLNKEVIPRWRRRRIQDIKRRDVLDICDEIVRNGKPVMANRVFSTIRRLFRWCIQRGILEASPIANLSPPSVEQTRDRVLGDDELKALWQACDGIGAKFGAIVRLLILTGQRRDEVAGMRWSELDLAAKIWTLPRERAKNDTEHAIPLSEQALAVIEGLPSERRGLIFTVTGKTPVSGFSKPKRQLDALIEKDLGAALPHWTFHDIRRSVASGLARLGQPVHVTEAVLNHRSGTIKGIARIYNRYDYASEKRGALDTWGRYVEQLVSGRSAGNVVELAAARG